MSHPLLSVIVPVHQGAAQLPYALAALRASDLPTERWELIVIDDSSTDASPQIARRQADRVLRVEGGATGPANARNLGAKAACGEILVFVDADVCVHADTLRRFAEAFERDPGVGAIFGAYDTTPAAPGVVSQYRNLVHHYVHAGDAGEAETFWAGCGAIRKVAFDLAGGFDHRAYPRPQIEDIELGYRLRALGVEIRLLPDIQATHLKRWTLGTMMVADLRDRGIPWMRLLLRDPNAARHASLNLKPREKLCTGLVGLAGLLFACGALLQNVLLLGAALLPLALVLVLNAPLFSWFASQRGLAFAAAVVPLRVLYYGLNVAAALAAWLLHHVGPPPLARAAPALGRSRATSI